MHVSDTSPIPKIAWLSRPVRLIIICGIVLIGAVMAVTGGLLLNLRDRDLVESERRLSGLALVLAEQIDRNFQSIAVIQTAVIERMRSVTFDAGLLVYRELDDALGLTTTAVETLAGARTGKNGRPTLVGWLRQSVFGRLAGYEDVNNAERRATIRRRAGFSAPVRESSREYWLI